MTVAPPTVLLLLLGCASPPAGPQAPITDSGSSDGGATNQPDDTGTAPPLISNTAAQPDSSFGSVLRVSWDQAAPGSATLRYRVDPGDWLSTPTQARDTGSQEQLVLGLPFDWEVELEVVVEDEQGTVHESALSAHTAAPPEDMPGPALVSEASETADPDIDFVMINSNQPGTWASPWWTLIVDRKGRVVWARESDSQTSTLFSQLNYEGTALLLDQSTFWTLFDLGEESEVVSLNLDGTEQGRWSTPGLHHDFVELPDGTLLWGANDNTSETLEELAPDGSRQTLWTCAPTNTMGPCSSNSLDYIEATDSVLFSVVAHQAVVELAVQTGEELRWFGRDLEAYGYAKPGMEFYKQHSVQLTDTGTLLMSSWDAQDGNELVIREYAIDAEAEQLELIWSFAEGPENFAYVLGDVERLPGGNTLHSLGRGSRLREITPDGQVAWDLAWPSDCDLGRVTALPDLYALLPDAPDAPSASAVQDMLVQHEGVEDP